MNDGVIYELFSIGMGLQGMLPSQDQGEQSARLEGYVDATDELIRHIRSAICELTPPSLDGVGLKRRMLEAVDEQSASRSLVTQVAFTGPLDDTLDLGVAESVLELMRVAVSQLSPGTWCTTG